MTVPGWPPLYCIGQRAASMVWLNRGLTASAFSTYLLTQIRGETSDGIEDELLVSWL
jgi:hypothetical protein